LAVLIGFNPEGDCIHCRESFNSDTMFYMFEMSAWMHVIVCTISFGSWITMRAPVLVYKAKREAYLKRGLKNRELEQETLDLTRLATTLASLVETAVESTVGRLPWRHFHVIRVLIHLKYNPELATQLLWIGTSLCGVVVSPLFYACHLFPASYNEDLELVHPLCTHDPQP
jgi:hypothetical protein